MKIHKNHADIPVLFNYAFPVLDNEFDMDMDGSLNRGLLDQESLLLREGVLPDNDNFELLAEFLD